MSDKTYRKIANTLCSISFVRKSYRFLYNVEKCCRSGHATCDDILQRMRIACYIPKATNTESEYVIRIASPQQQRLH